VLTGFIFTPSLMDGGTGYCFQSISLYVSLFLSLFHCQQDDEKTAGPIGMKFSGKVQWPFIEKGAWLR